jgi:hypothetical protein
MDSLNRIVPSHLKLSTAKVIDASGYSPEGVDLVVYKDKFRDTEKLLDGHIPVELVYGTFFLTKTINMDTIYEVLGRIMNGKKLNRYTDKENNPSIPAFVIAFDMDIELKDLKETLLSYYISKNIDNVFEFDVIMIMNRGIIIKDWRQKRSYIALETGVDTLKWFFVLINEYLDVEKDEEIDFRSYIKETSKYNEY